MGGNFGKGKRPPDENAFEEFDVDFARLRHFEFPFENIVFEGGGLKSAAYPGALKALQKVGILKHISRIAGVSSGSLCACLLAIGTPIEEIQTITSRVDDNMFKEIDKMLKDSFKRRDVDPEVTFKQVYDRFGKELCIVATNLTTRGVEYFHPKTTPDVPVYLAAKASMALPAFSKPVVIPRGSIKHNIVDGGLVCNFPLHCFDGWYLSMDPDDSFFFKLGRGEKHFEGFNEKTLGILLYSTGEHEILESQLGKRYGYNNPQRPKTQLARKSGPECDQILRNMYQKDRIVKAAQNFLEVLRRSDVNRDGEIQIVEFQMAFEKATGKDISKEDLQFIFGDTKAFDEAFREMDMDKNGRMTFEEFVQFMEKKGIAFRQFLEGGALLDIHGGQYMSALFETMELNVKRMAMTERDIERTIGIHTDYIGRNGNRLTPKDRKFVYRQGQLAVVLFLKEYIQRKNLITYAQMVDLDVTGSTDDVANGGAKGMGVATAAGHQKTSRRAKYFQDRSDVPDHNVRGPIASTAVPMIAPLGTGDGMADHVDAIIRSETGEEPMIDIRKDEGGFEETNLITEEPDSGIPMSNPGFDAGSFEEDKTEIGERGQDEIIPVKIKELHEEDAAPIDEKVADGTIPNAVVPEEVKPVTEEQKPSRPTSTEEQRSRPSSRYGFHEVAPGEDTSDTAEILRPERSGATLEVLEVKREERKSKGHSSERIQRSKLSVMDSLKAQLANRGKVN